MASTAEPRRRLTPHRLLTFGAALVGRPAALGVLLIYAGVWLAWDRGNIGWGGVATVLTLAMTIVIQGAQNRDTAALQAKLDELIRAVEGAREDFVELDRKETDEIETARAQMREDAESG